MTLARQLLAAGDDREGGAAARARRRPDGRPWSPCALLAEAHRSLGQFDRAASVLEQAAESNPRYYLALGDVYERQGKWEEAAAAYEKGSANVRGGGRELRLRRAAALLNIADGAGAERAITLLTEFVKTSPRDVTGQYAAGPCLSAAGPERGRRAGRRRRRWPSSPATSRSLGLLASVYRERYDFAAIVALLTPTTTDDAVPTGVRVGEFVRLLAELGGAQQQHGDYAAAVRTFERARSLLPDAIPVAAALAQAHLQAGQFDQAQRVARDARVTSAATGDLGLLRVEALAGVKAGRAADAVGFLERAIGARRSEPDAAFVLADVYEEAKRYDDAIKAVTALGGAAPVDDAVAFRLAAAYEAADRVPDAERVFRAILTRDPLHANALNFLGYMLADRGLRVAEALTLIDRALVAEPGNPAYLDSRGWALFKLGRAADAEEPLRRATTALRGSSVIQSHYAEVLATLGKSQEAASAAGARAGRRRRGRGPRRAGASPAPASPASAMSRRWSAAPAARHRPAPGRRRRVCRARADAAGGHGPARPDGGDGLCRRHAALPAAADRDGRDRLGRPGRWRRHPRPAGRRVRGPVVVAARGGGAVRRRRR